MKNFKETRILYMGTPAMSAEVLEALISEGFNIVAVVAQEDKPVGRKAILTEVPTKVVAKKYNIPVYQPHKLRENFDFIKEINPDLILTMAYGQIVPTEVLNIPELGSINLHGSILPKYRGAAPIQRAIMDGEKITGVTLMEMVDKMDAGKMFGLTTCEIEENDNYTSLCKKIVNAAIECAKKYVPIYVEEGIEGVEQDESQVTYAKKILPETEKLSLDYDSSTFINYVRGMSEEPGGYLYLNELKFKIFKARKTDLSFDGEIGTLVINKNVYLKLKDSVIELLEVQLAGKKKMDGKSFANGNKQLGNCILK